MSDAVRAALDRGDVDALAALVAADPRAAHEPIRWGPCGENVVPPLHYVCDVRWRGGLDQAGARAAGEVLLDAGVDPNLVYAASGDSFLVAAASLGAEDLGLLLVERGAAVDVRGLFGATPLHWCGTTGLGRLAAALVAAGADPRLADERHGAGPLGWTLHAWHEDPRTPRDGLLAVARVLVAAGAESSDSELARLSGPEHARLRAVLRRPT